MPEIVSKLLSVITEVAVLSTQILNRSPILEQVVDLDLLLCGFNIYALCLLRVQVMTIVRGFAL